MRIATRALAAAAAALLGSSAALAQSTGSPFAPNTPPITAPIPPPVVAQLPNAAYDLARGPAGPVTDGRGGWLPVIADPACPSGTRLPPPPVPLETDRTAAAAETAPRAPTAATGVVTKKAVATTATAAAAATTASPASRGDATAPVPQTPPAVGLKAGSTDDNATFDDYLSYRRKFLGGGFFAHDLDITERHVLRVVDGNGRPVLGAKVEITAADGTPLVDLRTFADGRTLFFPRLSSRPQSGSWSVRVNKNSREVTTRFDRSQAGHEIVLPGETDDALRRTQIAAGQSTVKLDVQFLIDTTGSMGDEIDRLRANMIEISRRIAALDSRPDVRFAMTVYRDCGDDFVSRTYDFDASVNRFNNELSTVRAGGGNDEPEHLNQALHDAVTRPGWRGDDTVKLVFLVADAPPHLDYPGDVDYALDSLLAARRGIKISPIASSGSNPVAEYVFRQLAQLTTGRFVFLTYGADGASPGDRTNLNVDAYETLALDQLVVRIATDELAWQGLNPPALPALPAGAPRNEPPLVPVAPPVIQTTIVSIAPPPFPPTTIRPIPFPIRPPRPRPVPTTRAKRVTSKNAATARSH